MSRNINKVSWLAWLWFGIMLIVTLVSLPDTFGSQNIQGSLLKVIDGILNLLIVLAFPLVGALIISRQPRNTIGWLLMVPSLAILLDTFTNSQISSVTVPPAHPSILFWIAAYLSNITWLLAIFPVFLIALLFPTGRSLSPRWRWIVAYSLGLFISFFIFGVFDKTIAPDSSLYGVEWSIPNPLGFLDTSTIDFLFPAWLAGVVVLALFCIISIVLRYRRAGIVERKQIKWLLYAVSLFAASYGFYITNQNWGQTLWGLFVDLFLTAIPIAIGIAILRYRLWDIDLIIRKTLQYALLSGLLGLVYFGSVILLQGLTENILGEQSPLVIVFSTLAIAALFNPLRIRVQEFIDRRFYRKKYDAEQALAEFAATARDEVELEQLTLALLGVVEETVQPEKVSMWLRSTNQAIAKTMDRDGVLVGDKS